MICEAVNMLHPFEVCSICLIISAPFTVKEKMQHDSAVDAAAPFHDDGRNAGDDGGRDVFPAD